MNCAEIFSQGFYQAGGNLSSRSLFFNPGLQDEEEQNKASFDSPLKVERERLREQLLANSMPFDEPFDPQ